MRKNMHIMLVGLLGIVASVIFGATLAHAVWFDNEVEVPASREVASIVSRDAGTATIDPARLIIPVLHINAVVEHTGLIAGDRMAAPHMFVDAGWYKYGPAPGAVGTAVILGHLDNGLGLDGVFKHLYRLMVGDEIDVVTEDGHTVHFRVEALHTYPYDAIPSDIFVSSDTVRLALVTCAGHWVYDKHLGMTYDHRLVVSARLMNSS